jgi:hypothetical protein
MKIGRLEDWKIGGLEDFDFSFFHSFVLSTTLCKEDIF